MVVLTGDARSEFIAPERSLAQRMAALQSANRIRSYRAQVKRDLKTGAVRFDELLHLDEPRLATMRVYDALLAVPSVGRGKAKVALARARVAPSKTLGGMTDRQRRDLLLRLAAWPSVRATLAGPASVRPRGTMDS